MKSEVSGRYILLRSCPLCASSHGRNLGSLCFKTFDNSPISGSVSLVACDSCGFAFYDTPDSQADFDQYYRQNAYYCTAETTGSGGSSPQDSKRFKALFQRVEPYIKDSGAAVFDVGCARGGLLSVLMQNGYTNVYGVDMLPECIRHVTDTLGAPAEAGSALDLPFDGVMADLLVYSHVVEHVVDLPELLAVAGHKLKDDGVIYVEVPDACKYGEYTGNPFQDLYLEHVNHFDPSSLVALFRSGGFEVLAQGRFELDTLPAGKVPCIWAVFGKGTKSREKSDPLLAVKLNDYLEWSGQHPALERFAELARAQTPLFLWGISQYAMLLIGQTGIGECNLRGFIDKDASKRRRTLLGRSIDSSAILDRSDPECSVMITAPGYETPIVSALESIKFRGSILTASGEMIFS